LEKLKHKIPWVSDLLTYREFFKLQTTYVIALQKLITKDGRIHPTFLQLGAATGRMSCQNPNLQNIPQESRWSKDIRNAFVSPDGFSLVAIDYSQIELRVLASLARDKNMIQAFEEGKDIHTITAQKIFNKPEHQINKQMRRSAKTLNFGMVYGMGFRALAQQANITNEEAKLFIKKYFEEFSSVKAWQEEVLTQTKKIGRVVSPTGRFRALPQIHSTNEFFASQARREAINMPVQGLAADVLKLAMLRVDTYLNEKKLAEKVHMILTIHDELIFEVDDELLADGTDSKIIKDLQHEMESAFPIDQKTKRTPLLVPIKTEVSIGKRWGELH
jgi:DNA polymerase-1